MTKREKAVLGSTAGIILAVAWETGCATDIPNATTPSSLDAYVSKVAADSDGVRLNYALHPSGAAAARLPEAGPGAGCRYLAAAAGDRAVQFADGNLALFPLSANRAIEFVTAGGARSRVGDAEGTRRQNWWCQEDGVVLFRTAVTAQGHLSGVKVDWLDSAGLRKTETGLNIPAYGDDVNWAYLGSRLVDECLGITLRVQEGASFDGGKPAQIVEYKLCPTGI